jgi:hypothetical protein
MKDRETKNFREGSFNPIPLRFILFPPLRFGERVVEGCVVGPEAEFLKGGETFE